MTLGRELWLVGAGRMGLALLQGWVNARLVTAAAPSRIVEPRPSEALLALQKAGAARLVSPPLEPEARERLIVLAVKPQMLDEALSEVRPLAEQAWVLSIVAGRTSGSIVNGLGNAKGLSAIRAMPNTPAAIGKGISTLYAPPGAPAEFREAATQLLAAVGKTIWVEREELIDAGTAISGSGPAYFFLLVEALAEAGMAIGLPPLVAAELARETLIGAGALLEASEETPAALRQAVTSPKGTTQAALDVLMASDGLSPLVRRAVEAAFARAKELGKV